MRRKSVSIKVPESWYNKKNSELEKFRREWSRPRLTMTDFLEVEALGLNKKRKKK